MTFKDDAGNELSLLVDSIMLSNRHCHGVVVGWKDGSSVFVGHDDVDQDYFIF